MYSMNKSFVTTMLGIIYNNLIIKYVKRFQIVAKCAGIYVLKSFTVATHAHLIIFKYLSAIQCY